MLEPTPTGSEREADPATGGSFAELLLWHMGHGTRPGGKPGSEGRTWLVKDFAHACVVSVRQVGKWRSGEELPDTYFDSISAAFFGDAAHYESYRTNFRRAFNAAKLKRDSAGIGNTAANTTDPFGKRAGEGPKVDPTPPPQPGWQPDPPWYLRENFARLNVEPQPGLPNDRFTLAVTLRLDSPYMKIEDGPDSPPLAVTVRVRSVEIVPDEENVQPVPGTILGRPGKEHPHVAHGVVWRIENPEGRNANPLDGTPLCDMWLRGNGPHGVKLVLRCRDIDLDIRFHDRPPEVSEKQAAVLRRVLQRMDCADPNAEYVELARGGLHREASP